MPAIIPIIKTITKKHWEHKCTYESIKSRDYLRTRGLLSNICGHENWTAFKHQKFYSVCADYSIRII